MSDGSSTFNPALLVLPDHAEGICRPGWRFELYFDPPSDGPDELMEADSDYIWWNVSFHTYCIFGLNPIQELSYRDGADIHMLPLKMTNWSEGP